jgi:hypothetical protein
MTTRRLMIAVAVVAFLTAGQIIGHRSMCYFREAERWATREVEIRRQLPRVERAGAEARRREQGYERTHPSTPREPNFGCC